MKTMHRSFLGFGSLLRTIRCVLGMTVLSAVGTAGTVNWVGGDGSWNEPTHWDTGALPGASDDVIINVPGDITVVLNGSVSIRSLNC